MQIERSKTNVETGYVKMPFPFISRQFEESTKSRGFDVIDWLARGFVSPWPYLFVMVAKHRHERNGSEKFGVKFNQLQIGFYACFFSGTTKLVDVFNVVTCGQQEMHVILLNGREIG